MCVVLFDDALMKSLKLLFDGSAQVKISHLLDLLVEIKDDFIILTFLKQCKKALLYR